MQTLSREIASFQSIEKEVLAIEAKLKSQVPKQEHTLVAQKLKESTTQLRLLETNLKSSSFVADSQLLAKLCSAWMQLCEKSEKL